jgi:hypothetical protein
MGSIADRNILIRFVGKYHAIGCKVPIILKRRPACTYPFGVFHISLGSTLCRELELKSEEAVDGLPSLDISVTMIYILLTLYLYTISWSMVFKTKLNVT